MKKLNLIFLLFNLLIISCQKKVNSSTNESFEKSIADITNSLNEEEKNKFQESIQLMMFLSLIHI